jgi:hypothetical protein
MEISGQLHTLATLSMGKKSITHRIGCWMDLKSLSGNFGTERSPTPAEIQTLIHPVHSQVTIHICYSSSSLYTCNLTSLYTCKLSKITDLKAANIIFTDAGET